MINIHFHENRPPLDERIFLKHLICVSPIAYIWPSYIRMILNTQLSINPYEYRMNNERCVTEHKNNLKNDGSEHFWSSLDKDVSNLVIKYKNDWKKICRRIKNIYKIEITPVALRERHRKLTIANPKKGMKFSLEEDLLLLGLMKKFGRDWIKISNYYESRGAISLKNRYYSAIYGKDYEKVLEEKLEQKNL